MNRKLQRHFSESFKREKVKLFEEKQITVRQLARIYEVSEGAVYKWIKKYSDIQPGLRLVVEKESEGAKTIELMEKVSELEQVVGQKQLKVDYLEKIIEVATKELGVDIKKKFDSKLSLGSKKTIKP